MTTIQTAIYSVLPVEIEPRTPVGFYYAQEIPIVDAKKRAVELWNNHQYVR